MKTRKYYQIVLLVFMVLMTSCEIKSLTDSFEKFGLSSDENMYGRLGKSKLLTEENDASAPVVERYFIRDEIVSVNHGADGTVKIFYVYLDDGLSKQGIANCLEGMERFNNLDLMFRLERTAYPKKAHIKAILKNSSEIGGVDARTLYPKRGMPGSLIKLNKSLYNKGVNRLPENMTTVFTHELGHAFGFLHMDHADNKFSCNSKSYKEKHSATANPVFGTASSSPVSNSFMLACMDRNENRPIILIDKIALSNVYGRHRKVGLPLLRYEGKDGYSNYYTADYNELMEGNDNYAPEGIIGRIFPEKTNDDSIIPLAYYFNAKTKDHFYTSVLSELGMGKNEYEFIRLYYVYADSDGKSRLPFIRFYNPKKQHHFYTSDATEAYELQKDKSWLYEGVIGYLSAYN